jgi:hypothetical protein
MRGVCVALKFLEFWGNLAAVIPYLFSWNNVEARSDLDRFYLVRDNIPDENEENSNVVNGGKSKKLVWIWPSFDRLVLK